MKRFHFVAGLLAAMACSGLHAQTIDLRANVPFDFRMGEKLMPAGEYLIHHSGSLLIVREQSGRHTSALALTLAEARPAKQNHAAMQFNGYGGEYFLAKIWTPDTRDGCVLPKSRREKEVASRAGPVHMDEISFLPK